jgi:c(7)-type cytochrome triheme protein
MRGTQALRGPRQRPATQYLPDRGRMGWWPRKFFGPAGLLGLLLTAGFVIAASSAPAQPELKLPPDIVYDKADGSPGPVVFRHAPHFELAGNRCTACHPAPFRMLRPARRITHDEMNAGRLCGTCHDGKQAAATSDDCTHCHGSAKESR